MPTPRGGAGLSSAPAHRFGERFHPDQDGGLFRGDPDLHAPRSCPNSRKSTKNERFPVSSAINLLSHVDRAIRARPSRVMLHVDGRSSANWSVCVFGRWVEASRLSPVPGWCQGRVAFGVVRGSAGGRGGRIVWPCGADSRELVAGWRGAPARADAVTAEERRDRAAEGGPWRPAWGTGSRVAVVFFPGVRVGVMPPHRREEATARPVRVPAGGGIRVRLLPGGAKTGSSTARRGRTRRSSLSVKCARKRPFSDRWKRHGMATINTQSD